jgi:hypothetical protein
MMSRQNRKEEFQIYAFPATPTPGVLCHSNFFSTFFSFWWDWALNSGLCTCKAGALLLKPHLQSILLCLFWRWGLENYFWTQTTTFCISASPVAGITGVSHGLAPAILISRLW